MQRVVIATCLAFATMPVIATVSPQANEGKAQDSSTSPTDYQDLERFVQAWSPQFQGQDGQWMFQVEQMPLMVLADQQHDRMRLLTPVADAAGLDKETLLTILQANFDRTLDGRYAIWKGQVWSVYLHPLSSLTQQQFDAAVEQVMSLRKNFGTTYASSELVFGAEQ